MTDSANDDSELLKLRELSIEKWLNDNAVDLDAFENLFNYIESRRSELKQGDEISKQVVKTMLEASNILLAAGNTLQSNRFFYTLGSILTNGESSEIKPGQPRII